MLQSGLTLHKAKHAKCVEGIMANEANTFTKEALEAKSMDEIEALAALAGSKPADGEGDAATAGDHSLRNQGRLKANDAEAIEKPPAMAWDKPTA